MPSQIEQADRRTAQYREELEQLRTRASTAATALNDSVLLRRTLERLVKVLAPSRDDAITVALQLGAAREALHEFEEAAKVVERVAELRRQIDALKPLTSAEAKVE